MTTRPHVLGATCNRCELCIRTCPAKAMAWGPPGKGEAAQHDRSVAIDLSRCTRCFCCQEVCPTGAIVVREGWLLKARSRLLPPNRFVR